VPTSENNLASIAVRALNDLTTLVRTELKLLRTEISEKLTISSLSAAIIVTGAFLLLATVVLLLQAAVAGLVAYGFSWPVAFLITAAITLVVGAGLVWLGSNWFSIQHLAPSKTINQLQKDATMAQGAARRD
jgi:Putative Actinobacterial Holin-X, holin superfamily III